MMSSHQKVTSLAVSDDVAQPRLDMIRRLVAQPIPPSPPWTDPEPALVDCVLIGNKYHAANVQNLLKLGVTAVLNCASGGISRLPVDELQENGIHYNFTNCRQDNYDYPILHNTKGECSQHLIVAKELYENVKRDGGKVLFFCVAGQNRSAALAVAVLMIHGQPLENILTTCSKTRPFILENVGFQRQLVELEAHLAKLKIKKGHVCYEYGSPNLPLVETVRSNSELELDAAMVEIELLIPGLCTMDVKIPMKCTIATVKERLVEHANKDLLSYAQEGPAVVAKSWVVLAMFGYDAMYDIPLEVEALELSAQLERMNNMFGLTVDDEHKVQWNEKCRFALVIFSVKKNEWTVPWTFCHEERPGAPATLLENTLMSTHLRAWDFVTGQAFASCQPIVFSFADDPRDKRQFMRISTSANEAQQFHAPGEGGILGMGANAIVHRVQLKPTSAVNNAKNDEKIELSSEQGWDAAVKRPFSLSKMLASLENSSEAGLAKRMRFANSLNSDGRVLYFYGLGVALAANSYNQKEYKFEATILARYEEEFSTYTMRRFMEDYVAIPTNVSTDEKKVEVEQLQSSFSLISVKVLLVSLLNAFRDLTLMGVQAFDFNHLNNVLVSRDHRTVRLIDIDGNSKGSIQFPSEYIGGSKKENNAKGPHKPSLDIDLNTLLPRVLNQLLLGKGRGPGFVTNKASEIWHTTSENAKAIIKEVILENFFPEYRNLGEEESLKTDKHLSKVAEWYYAMLKKASPWENWTNDIYDAMRSIDHLPIS